MKRSRWGHCKLAFLAVTLLAKILLRRPWFVDAVRESDGLLRRWAVVGWNRSGDVVDEIAEALERGDGFTSSDARELSV